MAVFHNKTMTYCYLAKNCAILGAEGYTLARIHYCEPPLCNLGNEKVALLLLLFKRKRFTNRLRFLAGLSARFARPSQIVYRRLMRNE